METQLEYAHLLSAVLPAFICAFSQTTKRPGISDDEASMALSNALSEMKLGMWLLEDSVRINPVGQAQQDNDACGLAKQNLLRTLEDLVDDVLLSEADSRVVTEYPRIGVLRSKIQELNIPGPGERSYGLPEFPTHILECILCYGLRASTPKTDQLIHRVRRFNSSMLPSITSRYLEAEPLETQLFHRDRNDDTEVNTDEQDLKQVHAAKKLCSATKSIYKLVSECDKRDVHIAHIQLDGFPENEISMCMGVCGLKQAEAWHDVCWEMSGTPAAPIKPNGTTGAPVCHKILEGRRRRTRLRIKLGQSDSWTSHSNIATDRLRAAVQPPQRRLEDVLGLGLETRGGSRPTKQTRLALAVKIARSLTCLIDSPFLQSDWNSTEIMVSENTGVAGVQNIESRAHALIEFSKGEEMARRSQSLSFVLYLGVILWELFFLSKVQILEEDVVEEDEERVPDLWSLFNALGRERDKKNDEFIHQPYLLKIIDSCLDISTEDEIDGDALRLILYRKILQPLESFKGFYADGASANDRIPASRPERTREDACSPVSVMPSQLEVHNDATPDTLPIRQRTCQDYTVAVICAMSFEMSAVRYMLSEEHPDLPPQEGDSNRYILGHVHGHNVVLACLPGQQGKGAAATVAANLHRSFPKLRWRFLVGIGGGVPSKKNDIRLGDVVVSMPDGAHHGVAQYDLGKSPDTGFQHKGFLLPPPARVRSAIEFMRSDHMTRDNKIRRHVSTLCRRHPKLGVFDRPNEPDILFLEEHSHPSGAGSCLECDASQIISRPERDTTDPIIHYGLIASGDSVLKSSRRRADIIKDLGHDVLCFEMEAAGPMSEHEFTVVRGISDYADSHKNDSWHSYAAATAAACTIEILGYMSPGAT